MGGELKAEIKSITSYSAAINKLAMSAEYVAQPLVSLQQMNQLAFQAFEGASAGGQFAEGPMMIAAVQRNSVVFEEFMHDLMLGVTAIANAAQVCADTYQGADNDNAGGIDAVNFAFADPGAARPHGLSSQVGGHTLMDLVLQQEQSNGGSGAAGPESALNPDGGRVAVSLPGYTLTIYPDGSSRSVGTVYDEGGGTTTETIVYGANGAVVTKTADSTTYVTYGDTGATVRTIVNTTGGISTGSIITTAADGSQTVQSTRNGKPYGDPVTVPADQDPDQEGPVQQAVKQYQGWDTGVTNYGDDSYPTGEPYWGGAGVPQQYAPTVPAPTPGAG
jgi:hypothetical protein